MRKGPSFFFFLILLVPVLSAQTGIVRSSNHENLQEAFDAVPETVGIVYIAPVTYELSQPLILSQENIRIEGPGPATHIINKNDMGEPALLVRPDGHEVDPKKRIWLV